MKSIHLHQQKMKILQPRLSQGTGHTSSIIEGWEDTWEEMLGEEVRKNQVEDFEQEVSERNPSDLKYQLIDEIRRVVAMFFTRCIHFRCFLLSSPVAACYKW